MELFPAHAGVIPLRHHQPGTVCSFPRTRGGDPKGQANWKTKPAFSPHTRGGSGRPQREHPQLPGFARVIPKLLSVLRYAIPLPRTCGGDPETSAMGVEVQCFSPHTRG